MLGPARRPWSRFRQGPELTRPVLLILEPHLRQPFLEGTSSPQGNLAGLAGAWLPWRVGEQCPEEEPGEGDGSAAATDEPLSLSLQQPLYFLLTLHTPESPESWASITRDPVQQGTPTCEST